MGRGNLSGASVALGQITVGKQLGAGGFGVVHEATLSGLNFPFAIKFLQPSPFASEASKARERFFKEAELLLKLRHPHIIAIYGVGEHEGRPYILMEHFAGISLRRDRDREAPSPNRVLPFIERVAGAMAYAHTKGVVHRDINPSNLMSLRGDPRVLDFGIAAVLDPEGTRLTQTGGALAGDSFSPPELIENARLLDHRCDIYSVGACWFWLLTGRTPKGLDWQAALREVDGISPDYERVVLRCLAQVDKRYATMDEFAAAVRALQAGVSPAFRPDDLTDNDALVLGAVAAECPHPGDSVNPWTVEQAVAPSVNKFNFGVSNRKLLRLKLLEKRSEEDWNGNETVSFRLTATGEHWVETHHSRISALMADTTTPAPKPEDDVPF